MIVEGERHGEDYGLALVGRIVDLAREMEDCSDEQLRTRSDALRISRIAGDASDGLIPEALAIFREATRRTIGVEHSETHLMAGVAMCLGQVAELPDGAERGLAETLPTYWHALAGLGVHAVVTADYQVERDAVPMGAVLGRLGGRVGILSDSLAREQRRLAYEANVTYGTWDQFMTDYLQDNLQEDPGDIVQRGQHVAVLSDVHAVLIDRANVPVLLTVSNSISDSDSLVVADVAAKMRRGEHYEVRRGAVVFTRRGATVLPSAVGGVPWREPGKGLLLIHIESVIAQREGLPAANDRLIQSLVGVCGYFQRYDTLIGVARVPTSPQELRSVYGLGVCRIVGRDPVRRIDHPDVVYRTDATLVRNLAHRVAIEHTRGRPVVVAAASTTSADQICEEFDRMRLEYRRLAAGGGATELANAGRRGSLTVFEMTTYALDEIVLGGDVDMLAIESMHRHGVEPTHIGAVELIDTYLAAREVARSTATAERADLTAAGGLAVFGLGCGRTRHANAYWRRLAGAGGERGETWSMLSMTDPLLLTGRRWQPARTFRRLLPPSLQSRNIRKARGLIEMSESERRLASWSYVSVEDVQLRNLYSLRRAILDSRHLRQAVHEMIDEVVDGWSSDAHLSVTALRERVAGLANGGLAAIHVPDASGTSVDLVRQAKAAIHQAYVGREHEVGSAAMRALERKTMLSVIDAQWSEHVNALNFMRKHANAIYPQGSDPLEKYRRDACIRFRRLVEMIRFQSLRHLLN